MSRWIFAVSTAAFFALSATRSPGEGGFKLDSSKGGAGAPAAEPVEEENRPEILGKPAPDCKLDPLATGDALDLAAHKGKDIVILDFWATWCGPCVMALPLVTEVANAYREKGVAFYAVNEGEEPATIRDFLKAKKLDINVVLDAEGKAGHLFEVRGIPQTVIIDKTGTVQVVHVGYSPNLKQELSRNLDDILAGKNLAKPKALSVPKVAGLEAAWSLPGRYGGIAVAGGKLFALGSKGHCEVVDAAGKSQGAVTLEESGTILRAAKLGAGDDWQLLSFQAWGPELRAYDSQGKPLWVYSGGEGVNDVGVADLDGDGLDEVIVGYNGSTGLHVLTRTGKLRWKDAAMGNIWHVSAGDLWGAGTPAVAATSAAGDVHVFDAGGKKLPDLQVGLYANMVRVVPAAKGQKGTIVVGGSAEDREDLAAFDADGKKLWMLTASDGKGHIDSASAAPGRPWLAISMRGGRLLVIDTEKGAVIGEASGEAPRGEVAWMEAGDAPLLVVTGRDALHSYRVAAK